MNTTVKIDTPNVGQPITNEMLFEKMQQIEERFLKANKKVLNLRETAELTGFTIQHLRKLLSKRVIPFYQPTGKTIFFNREEVEAWLLSGKRESNEEVDAEEWLNNYINS